MLAAKFATGYNDMEAGMLKDGRVSSSRRTHMPREPNDVLFAIVRKDSIVIDMA